MKLTLRQTAAMVRMAKRHPYSVERRNTAGSLIDKGLARSLDPPRPRPNPLVRYVPSGVYREERHGLRVTLTEAGWKWAAERGLTRS